jgi:hypothetical protein
MYKKMIEQARKDGVASEKTMWESIADVDMLLIDIKEVNPEVVRKFMRRQHELLYGPHYNELMAIEAVSGIKYTDKEGKAREGAYWTIEEVEAATRGMEFPARTTKWDKYVAFNSFRSDVCRQLEDADALKAAHAFYFADEDYQGEGKIWHYMGCINK